MLQNVVHPSLFSFCFDDYGRYGINKPRNLCEGKIYCKSEVR